MISQRSKLVTFVAITIEQGEEIEFVLGAMDTGIDGVLGEFEEDTTEIYTIDDYQVSTSYDQVSEINYVIIIVASFEKLIL